MKKMNKLWPILLSLMLLSPGVLAQSDSLKELVNRGGRQLYVKKYNEAISTFEKALAIDSNNFESLQNLGMAHSALGNQGQARKFFEKAYAVNPQDAEINNNLGVNYSNGGDVEKAIKYFEAAVNYDTLSALFRANLGMEYLKIGRTIAGLPHLHKANGLKPNQPEILFSLGNGYAASNRPDSAEFFYERCQTAGGRTPGLFYFLGRIKDKLGKSREAEENFKKALELKVDYPDCIRSLGILYIMEARYTEATMQFERALAIDSAYPGSWIGLGAAYALEGRTKKADSILNMLMATDTTLGNELLRVVSQERARQKEKSEK